jgi:hypothetical protein
MKLLSVIKGGLGNQIFQWALTKSLEQKYNCDVYLDIDEYEYSNWNGKITKRTFDLHQFPNLKFKLKKENINNLITLTESNFNPNTNLLNPNINYKLDGYWQNYNFFDNVKDVINQELIIPKNLKNELYIKYPELNNVCVSLHVRRTDYLTSNGFHPVQDLFYYKNAINLIGDYDNILIFSDDIQWCKENLKFKNQIFIEGNSPYIDIWLMSLCTHNIIANSSFSWWGAWLNNNKHKKVIIPSKWYSYGDVPHMSPQEWIKI